MGRDCGSEGKIIGVCSGTTIKYGVRCVEIVGLILRVVQLEPAIAIHEVRTSAFGTVPGGMGHEQNFVDDNNPRNRRCRRARYWWRYWLGTTVPSSRGNR